MPESKNLHFTKKYSSFEDAYQAGGGLVVRSGSTELAQHSVVLGVVVEGARAEVCGVTCTCPSINSTIGAENEALAPVGRDWGGCSGFAGGGDDTPAPCARARPEVVASWSNTLMLLSRNMLQPTKHARY